MPKALTKAFANKAGVAKTVISAAPRLVPGLAGNIAEQLVALGLNGVWKLPGAHEAAQAALVKKNGDVERAIAAQIRTHVALSGAQGFVTNLGGIAASLVSLPANIAGLAVINAHLVGVIAHLRGYDIDNDRVRMAIAMCLLGEGVVDANIADGDLPASPMVVATSPVVDPSLKRTVSTLLATTLSAVVGGKQALVLTLKKVPLIGGGFGAAQDGYTTYEIGRYAQSQFVSRNAVIDVAPFNPGSDQR